MSLSVPVNELFVCILILGIVINLRLQRTKLDFSICKCTAKHPGRLSPIYYVTSFLLGTQLEAEVKQSIQPVYIFLTIRFLEAGC